MDFDFDDLTEVVRCWLFNMSCWSALLSPAARERCIALLRQQPTIDLGRHTKTAAVLIPLCIVDDAVSLLYTLRSTQLKNHSGQISFPGGMEEAGESAVQTALRETEEELGLPRERVDVWGTGVAVPGRDRSVMVTPVIGFIRDFDPAELRPCANEVEEVFTVPVKHLCKPENHGYTEFTKHKLTLPVFFYEKYRIWGLTAYITHVFLQSLVPLEHYSNNLSHNRIDPNDLMTSSKL